MSKAAQANGSAWLCQVQQPADDPNSAVLLHAAVWGETSEQAQEELLRAIQADSNSKIVRTTAANDISDLEQKALLNRVTPFVKVALGQTIPLAEPYDDKEYLTITEHDISPLPEQKGVPFWDKEWIVPELKALLFDQPDPQQRLNTFFVVDATLRRAITKFFDLTMLDVPVKCLFTDMSLTDEALNDKDKVPHFHKDFFENHLGQGTGIIIRSTASMGELHHHLRKFTKVQNEKGKWCFFRFWEYSIFIEYWKYFSTSYELVSRFFAIKGFVNINHMYFSYKKTLTHIESNAVELKKANQKITSYCLTNKEHDFFGVLSNKHFKNKVIASLLKKMDNAPGKQKVMVPDAVNSAFDYILKRSNSQLVKQKDCYVLSLLIILLGEKASEVLKSPLLNDALIPVSHRIELAKNTYLHTMTRLLNS